MNAIIAGKELKQGDGVKITLGEKERNLSMDFNVICELENKYGTFEKASNALGGGKMKDVRFLLYAMLKQDDESLTEKAVGHMITLENMQPVIEALGASMKASVPQADEKNVKNPQEV